MINKGLNTSKSNLKHSSKGTLSSAIKSTSKSQNKDSKTETEFSQDSQGSFAQRISTNSEDFATARLSQTLRAATRSKGGSQAFQAASSTVAPSETKSSWLGSGASQKDGIAHNLNNDLINDDGGGHVGPDIPDLPDKMTNDKDPLVPNPDGVKLSQSEFDVIRYTNALRVEQGKDPLIVKQDLVDTSRLSSQRMDNKNQMVHGLTSGWRGENIAVGQDGSKDVVTAWKNSSGHYRNMMSDNFKYIGVGDTMDGNGNPFWTQQFG